MFINGKSGAVLAAAALTLAVTATSFTPPAAAGSKVMCQGVNACKGQSACKSASSSCAGLNSCKGQGWIKASVAQCKKWGGKILG
jgi:uncharacterized membrane protein